MRILLRGLIITLLATAVSGFAAAAPQATTGTIEGGVADQSGAVLPAIVVDVKNTQTGVSRTVMTDDRGSFRALSLPVGIYEISVDVPGFAPFKQSGVVLTVGQTVTFNIGMIVRGTASEVSVTADAPLIETSRTQISSTVDDRAVANLPVNGRNFIDFVLLTPGVTRDTRTGDISFAGQRGTLNSLVVDGADNNNTFFGQTAGRTGSGETTIKRSQFADTVSYINGAHSLKFGGDWNIDRILNFFPGNFSGAYTFASLAGFASGRPTGTGERYVQAFAGQGTTGATTKPNLSEFAAFFQDDYRATTRLTLNFGLRYDFQGFEQPTTRNPDPQLAAAGIDTSKIPLDKNNWAPRFGFAFKPLDGDRLVVRGGYGLFFGRTPSIMIGTAHSNNGLNVQTITVTGSAVPTYPNKLDTIPAGASAPAPTIFYFSNDYVSPYTEQANLSSAATTVRTQLFAVTGGQLVRQSNFGTVSGAANPRVIQLAAKILF